jgi:hypothetical protein
VNTPIKTEVTIVVPPQLVEQIDALSELYVQKLDGDGEAIRRLVETSILTHGIRCVREGLDK